MAKRTATQRNIANINAYIKDVVNIYGKGSQQYEDITNAIADFDIYENKNGILQISNTKSNRKYHATIRALRNKTRRIRSGQRWRKARAESKRNPVQFKMRQRIKKSFIELLQEVYDLIEKLEEVDAPEANELYELRYFTARNMYEGDYDGYNYYKDIYEQRKAERDYLWEQQMQEEDKLYGGRLTNPDFFD